MTPDTRILLLKITFAGFCLPSIALGSWMLIMPSGFWEMMGVSGGNPTIQILYGGAICGEAVVFGLGAWKPLRYMTTLHYLIPYKCFGCAALVPRLLEADPTPWGSWAILAAWIIPAIIAAAVYPWGQWDKLVLAQTDRQEL